MAYPEGIERALAKAQGNAQSEFVISVGDNVEGYNRDAAAVTRMWEDFDARLRPFAKPFFRLPGNHDLSNPVMLDVCPARRPRPHRPTEMSSTGTARVLPVSPGWQRPAPYLKFVPAEDTQKPARRR
jgi:hypothetical protein